MARAAAVTPTICMICCLKGVAPTICPALRSCMLSPAMAAAQQTTAPTRMAVAAAAVAFPVSTAKSTWDPSRTRRTRLMVRIVAMVTPEMGLLDDPTRPAMYPATDEKRKPATKAKTTPRASVDP